MSTDNETVAVRVSREKKKRWEDYVEESHQPTLSQLIRIATEREIARGNPLDPPEQGGAEQQEPAPEVMHKLEQISNKLQSLDRRLSAIESDRYGDDDLTELATELFRILPTSIAEIQRAIAEKQELPDTPENQPNAEYLSEALGEDEQSRGQSSGPHDQTRPNTGSVADLAVILEADEEAVQLAIQRLKSTTHSVHSTGSAEGTTHYYKED